MVNSSFLAVLVSTTEQLARLGDEPSLTDPMKDQNQKLQMELNFLKMFSWCWLKFEEAGKNVELNFAINTISSAVEVANKRLYSAGLWAIRTRRDRNWRLLTSNLLKNVEQFKSEIRKNCNFLLNFLLNSIKSSTTVEIYDFMDFIIMNLKDLSDTEDEQIASVYKQTRALEEKLRLIRKFIDFTVKRCYEHQKFEDSLVHLHSCANKVAWLSFLCWVNKNDENMQCRINIMLSDLHKEIWPCAPGITGMYLEVLKALKVSACDTLLVAEIVADFVNFLLENLPAVFIDRIEIIREGLIIIIAFLVDSPEDCEDDGDKLLTQADAIVTEAASLFYSIFLEEMNENVVEEKKFLLFEVIGKIERFLEVVKKFYVYIPGASEFYSLRTHGIGYIDFILENLKKMLKQNCKFVPFVKHKVVMVQEELQSLRTFLTDKMDGQNEHEELKDLWRRTINVAYHAEHVTDLSLISCSCFWYSIICLSTVIQEIKITKTEIENIGNKHMKKPGILIANMNSMHPFAAQASNSRIDEAVIGFDDEAETIINRLTRGSEQLEIVSIIGMPGQGKTTLAKKVYNHPSICYHFIQCVWCCVSQEYEYRSALLEMLCNVTELSRHDSSEMSNDELANRLRKCLIGRSYLIVMDDIWDIRPWSELKGSFPDNNNGSRILFTSRIQKLSWQDECKCYFHTLRPFHEEECWQLLKQKTFHKDECPQDLVEVGMEIARKCKGLPLSIVLVAGILARSKNSLYWWKQIAFSLSSSHPTEGSMDILELSYKHLPDHLKPCFLYLGAFSGGQKIRARKMTLLWISEGFIGRTDQRRLEDVAMECLMDLINHSLVIVSERSSDGGIKGCQVHNLLHEFCVTKAKEEKFLQLIYQYDFDKDPSDGRDIDMHRLCFHGSLFYFADSHRIFSPVHSIIFAYVMEFVDYCFFRTFRLLKVLDMERLYLKGSDLDALMLLVHLRYLAISGSIRRLPSSIANLWNLETLIVIRRLPWSIDLPDTIWQMKSLRHVNARAFANVSLGDYEFEELFQLENVHTFSTVLCHGRDTEILLRRLPRLRKLSCIIPESGKHQVGSCKVLDFSILSELEALDLSCMVGTEFSTPKIPAFEFPKVLKKLTLFKCFLPTAAISAIGQLPNLVVLKLRNIDFAKHILYVKDGEFLNLKFLAMHHSEFESWAVPDEPFPSLENLVLTDCTKLKEIPSSFADISTLKMIKIRGCCPSVEKSAQTIYEEQKDMGNGDLRLICS
ncbi:putative late blight resistance protein homolog R1A-3 [Coffea arabica]|uniref:Late blight resistance protein homolog R1A-3 n=1 Tax=Coffea arabica TaxID=13443 RepID=A0A6P6XAH3_COFAR|nr:putative late blight resistance protein homolog R1A-3 [Coffea arabica]